MTKEEFANEMRDRIEKEMGEGYEVSVLKVAKNNGVEMTGICVKNEETNISPTLYVDQFYEDLQHGREMDELLDKAAFSIKTGMPGKNFDVDFFRDYDRVKDKICYRLVNADENAEMLRKVPHERFLDLAVEYYCPVDDPAIGKGSILITNDHLKLWGVTQEDIKEAAEKNTPGINPARCYSMENMLGAMMGFEEERDTDELPEDLSDQEGYGSMHILTNRDKTFGAGVMLYGDFMQRISEAAGSDLFVIPSSIHEIIILPKTGDSDAGHLREIIQEVNGNSVSKQEFLSNNLYLYDGATQKISIYEGITQNMGSGSGMEKVSSALLHP